MNVRRSWGINQYHECQFIRRRGSSDGGISTTNLFNRLILHFNPSLIPSLFSFRLSDECLSRSEGRRTVNKEGRVSKERERARARQKKEKGGREVVVVVVVEEEKWYVYGALWPAAISSLNLQCGVDGL